MHTIKPLDTNLLDDILDMKLIVSIEEHSVIGFQERCCYTGVAFSRYV